MRPLLLLLAALALTAVDLPAQRTTRRNLKLPAAVAADTFNVAPQWLDSLVVSGYQKRLSSNTETLHITNRTPMTIGKVKLRLVYSDYEGNMLHSRDVTAAIDLPPGHTRAATLRSWDTQNRYYYLHGPRPRVAAYGFTVAITPLAALCTEASDAALTEP